MADRVILTDRREELLEDYDPSDQTERNAMSRFRSSTRTALDELIEIARSPQIDNAEVFDQGKIEELVTALYTSGDFEPFRTFDGDRTEYSQHIAYQLDLHNRLGRLNNEFSSLAHGEPDLRTGLRPPEGYDGLDE